MIPIYLHDKSGHDSYFYDEFESDFLRICETHREEGRALAFAFILYDFTSPQVAKVLRDQDYWNALDQLSGKYLTVFSFHTRPASKRVSPMKIAGFGICDGREAEKKVASPGL